MILESLQTFHVVRKLSLTYMNAQKIYISCHLRLIHCSEPVPWLCGKFLDVPEAIVLLYRSGIFSIDSSTLKLRICQKHRDNIGLKWRRNKARCCHPNHNKQSKSKPFRGATPTFCKEYWLKTRRTIPVGSGNRFVYLIMV